MPAIPALHEQHRRAIGVQTNRQDNEALTLQCYDRYLKRLADTPGLHSSNAQRQALAPALLQVMACLSSARPTPETLAVIPYTQGEHRALIPQLFTLSGSPSLPSPKHYRRDVQAPLIAPPAVNKPITLVDMQDAERMISIEQRKSIDRLLQKKHAGGINSRWQRLNKLVHYLQSGAEDKKRSLVAGRLIRTAGGYYSHKKHNVAESWKSAAIVDFILYELLGMPFNQWALLLKDTNHGAIEKYLTSIKGLNAKAQRYILNHVLHKVLPTVTLQLSATERDALSKMDILQPEWGYLHAGALLLDEAGVSLEGMALAEIQDIGMLLETLLRHGALPADYGEYFRLPALLHNQFKQGEKNYQDDGQILQNYFSHNEAWITANNPFFHLQALANNWKTRRELASELLRRHHLNDKWLLRWLNYHAPMAVTVSNRRVNLPDIDEVFDQQNEKLAQANRRVEHLILDEALEKLPQTEQQFIMRAQVERVSAEFNAMSSLYGVPLPPQTRMAMSKSDAMNFRIPDNIELIKCSAGKEVRIYAFLEHKESGWRFKRVDDDREQLLDLLQDKRIPAADPDYKVKFTSPVLLKKTDKSLQKIILQLAEMRYKKIVKSLGVAGYEKTHQEKARDFLLSLIPFYTCVSESIKGNIEEAMPACAMDIVSVIPFVGTVLATSTKFGIALSRATVLALRYGVQQAGLNQLLKKSGSIFIKQFSTIAETISPQVMRGLGNRFISTVDPGFNLLMLAGEKGIDTLGKIIAQINPRHQGLERLTTILQKRTSSSLRPANQLKIKNIYSQLHGKDLDVALTGTEMGREIWVRIDRQTGERFGRKYIRNTVGFLEPAPIKLNNRFYQLKTSGLGGKGSKFADAAWGQSAGPTSRMLIPSTLTDFNDFTITTFNQLMPVEQKELIILAHGRLRSRFRKITAESNDIYFYTELNKDFEASNAEILQFQTRRSVMTPQEIVTTGTETRDYELQHANGPFEDTYAKFRYHSRLLNSDIISGSNNGKPLHDVLIIKKDHTLSLAKLLEQIPPYSKIHCLFCRTRAMP